jgi:hypothetical protein
MDDVKEGLAEAITGVVLGFMLITIVNAFARDDALPAYFLWLFGLFSLILNVVTLNSFRTAGILYSVGWLGGAWLVISLLTPVDIVFKTAGPIVVLVLRAWFWIKEQTQ